MKAELSLKNESEINTPLLQQSCRILQLTDDLPTDQLIELRNLTSERTCQCLAHLAEVIQKIRYSKQNALDCVDTSSGELDIHQSVYDKMSQVESQVIQVLFDFAQSENLIDKTKTLRMEYHTEDLNLD